MEKEIEDKDIESVYCEICSGCGEEGCCQPTMCTMDKDGKYCEWYLADLRFGYAMYRDMYKLIEDNPKLKEELKEKIDAIFHENYKLFYNR